MTFKEILQLCWKHLALIIFVPLLACAISIVFCWGFLPNQYTAQKAIYVLSKEDPSSYGNEFYQTYYQAEHNHGITYSQQLCNDVAELVKSNRVRDAVAKDVGVYDLSGYDINVDSSEKNRVITLKVTSTDPLMASKVVDSLATHTITLSEEMTDAESVSAIDKSKVPDSPSGPPRLLITLVVLLVVTFLTLIAMLFRDVLDTTIKSREDLVEVLRFPVLSTIPKVKI